MRCDGIEVVIRLVSVILRFAGIMWEYVFIGRHTMIISEEKGTPIEKIISIFTA
jgi:hypothetical protein